MKRLLFLTFTLGFVALATAAQTTEKKDVEKPTGSTIDSWRTAMPQTQSADPPQTVMAESAENVEAKETPEQVATRIGDLERRLMDATKLRDADTLKLLIGDDFVLAGLEIPGTQSDKDRYIDYARTKLELRSYEILSVSTRVYGATAVINYRYRRQAAVAGTPSSGDFVVTDVWVRRSKRWQEVSHHISTP